MKVRIGFWLFSKTALRYWGNRRAVVANDLTKKFETHYRGTISEIISKLEEDKIRGEFVVSIEGLRKEKTKRERIQIRKV